MAVLASVILVAIIAVSVFAAVTGKVKLARTGCCCPADPRQDLRMRAAFEEPIASEAPTERS